MQTIVVFATLVTACTSQIFPNTNWVNGNWLNPLASGRTPFGMTGIASGLNKYWLYTRRNPLFYQTLTNDANSIRNSNFDIKKPVAVIVHGWSSNGYSDPNLSVRPALLKKDDVNVITLDWSERAIGAYISAMTAVPSVGRQLGQFLIFLNKLGVPWTNMHLIGFSLGAHIVGFAGRGCGGRIARITALDPAGPMWEMNPNKISASDAVYVEAIHTSGGLPGLGLMAQVGHVDFYPNGGRIQPGCTSPVCNHLRSCQYYASTIINRHLLGTQCSSMQEMTMNACKGNRLEMGNGIINKKGKGIYHLKTGMMYPY